MRPMIVCVCHNVNERKIADCVDAGVDTIKQLCAQTRAGTRCGKCLCQAREVLNAALTERNRSIQATNALTAVALQGAA